MHWNEYDNKNSRRAMLVDVIFHLTVYASPLSHPLSFSLMDTLCVCVFPSIPIILSLSFYAYTLYALKQWLENDIKFQTSFNSTLVLRLRFYTFHFSHFMCRIILMFDKNNSNYNKLKIIQLTTKTMLSVPNSCISKTYTIFLKIFTKTF